MFFTANVGLESEPAQLSLATDRGLTLARFAGTVRSDQAHSAIEAIASHAASTSAAAGVVDYRDADAATALNDLRRRLGAIARRTKTGSVPVALVVRGDEMPFWQDHARRIGASGLLRAAFTCPTKARHWAAEMAALYAAQARFRARG